MKRFCFERFVYFFLSLLLLPIHFAFATELSSIYAVPTTHLAGASANYKFYLTLNGSASWIGGETMTLTFPSGYGLTSFTEDDVDVAVASVDFTTAASCGGSEQMGVGISGTAVTFEMCTGDGGSVSSGSVIEIELGVNASSSGAGAHRITHPSNVGSYFIAVSGTFGADGSVIVPIAASSGSGVSVTVPASSGGSSGSGSSGGGGGSVPDRIPSSKPDEDPDPLPEPDPIPDPDPTPDPAPDDQDPTPDPAPSPDPENPSPSDSGNGPDAPGGSGGGGDTPQAPSDVDGGEEGGDDDVVLSGVVYEIIDGKSVGVSGATVTVLFLDGSIWSTDVSGQASPFITENSGGGFSWRIHNGTYLVRVEKDGYKTSETTVTVTNGILAPTLFISRDEKDLPVVVGDVGAPDEEDGGGVFEEVPNVARVITDNALEVFQDATLEEVVTVAVPAAAIVMATVATLAVGGSQFWLLLYSFFSQPFLFFTRKKDRKVGVVYHSVTKVPLDLVTVRVYNAQTNRLVKTVVTNAKGEFFLRISEEGTYRLQAVKQGFLFPSTYLSDVKEDGSYVDVYAGQSIVFVKHADPLTVSIPLDPVGSPVSAKVLKWGRTKRRIAFVLSPLSVLLSLGVFVVHASLFTGVFLVAQIALYMLTWRIAHKKRGQTWGIVYDEATRRPVGNVVIRLFEPKYNKLVDSLISDANGRYVFALGPNEYYVTFAKDGYLEATVKPVDFKNRKDISLFGINLPLRRHDGAAHE